MSPEKGPSHSREQTRRQQDSRPIAGVLQSNHVQVGSAFAVSLRRNCWGKTWRWWRPKEPPRPFTHRLGITLCTRSGRPRPLSGVARQATKVIVQIVIARAHTSSITSASRPALVIAHVALVAAVGRGCSTTSPTRSATTPVLPAPVAVPGSVGSCPTWTRLPNRPIQPHRIDVADRVALDIRIRVDPPRQPDGIGLGVDPTRREFTVPRARPWARFYEGGRVEEDRPPAAAKGSDRGAFSRTGAHAGSEFERRAAPLLSSLSRWLFGCSGPCACSGGGRVKAARSAPAGLGLDALGSQDAVPCGARRLWRLAPHGRPRLAVGVRLFREPPPGGGGREARQTWRARSDAPAARPRRG
jgi:hypothetical protein